MDARAPVLPETHLTVFHRVHAEAVKARVRDPIAINRRHVRADINRLRAEIVQPAEFAQLDLLRVVVILDRAVIVEKIRERRVGGVGVERRGVFLGRTCVGQRVAVRRERRVPVDVVERAAVIDHDILDDEQTPGVCGVHHDLQVGKRAPMRINRIKICAGVTVIFAAAVFDDGRNPDRRRAERPDVIQLLLDATEVAAVDARAAGGVVGAGGIVVGSVAIEEAVGENLVDALRLPETVGTRLGQQRRSLAAQEHEEGTGQETDCFSLGVRRIHQYNTN